MRSTGAYLPHEIFPDAWYKTYGIFHPTHEEKRPHLRSYVASCWFYQYSIKRCANQAAQTVEDIGNTHLADEDREDSLVDNKADDGKGLNRDGDENNMFLPFSNQKGTVYR